ncbi:MAG: hypothetical protein Q8Q37_00360 [bacterium]|nr:hypothetical protein [bacterium]
MKKITSIITTGLVLATPFLGLAQQQQPLPPRDLNAIMAIFTNITNWLFAFLLVLATIFVIIAAFNYLTAGGDDEKIKGAHKIILYAAVAIAVGLLAKSVEFIVRQLINA